MRPRRSSTPRQRDRRDAPHKRFRPSWAETKPGGLCENAWRRANSLRPSRLISGDPGGPARRGADDRSGHRRAGLTASKGKALPFPLKKQRFAPGRRELCEASPGSPIVGCRVFRPPRRAWDESILAPLGFHSCKFPVFSPYKKFFCNFTITLLQNILSRCKITASC